MALARVQEEAKRRIGRVLDLLEGELTEELAPWYPGRDEFAIEIVDGALVRFGKTFDRWRDLFAAAEQQRDMARRTMDDYSAPQREKRAAQSREAQAVDQLNLLQQGTQSQSSDFYTYRYLATEGFLPGYNFPRLPLMAYIPTTNEGKGRQTYLQRPRFLALAEFGPRSLVYHEGRAYRVVRAMLSLNKQSGAARDAKLPTKSLRICKNCGAGHFKEDISMCHGCDMSLGDSERINHIYRIENVATQPAERITANDEERQRQGFDLQTTFEWAERDHIPDVRKGIVRDDGGEVASLTYGPGATITRVNKGLRRRANRTQVGFQMDSVSGYWGKNNDEDGGDENDPTAATTQWIVPTVQDRKNALLLKPTDFDLSQESLATVQHALLRGIQGVFQLEESEVLAEPMPTRDARSGFLLYEATEGGAGVLTRLVSEPTRLAEVAQRALSIMHFDLDGGLPTAAGALKDLPETECVAACYRCLMSYYNQPDHELLDRRDENARRVLLRLARGTLEKKDVPATRKSSRPAPATVGTGIDGAWLAQARSMELPDPDAKPLTIGGTQIALVWRAHYVVALFEQAEQALITQLDDKNFEIVTFGPDAQAWAEPFARLAKLVGRES
jgi:hypothetical protein